MNRLLIGEEYLALENKRIALLKYFILEQSKAIEKNENEITTYGFEIEEWNGNNVEKSFVNDVTTEKDYALKVTDCLMKNKVMPVHLKDVLVDLL